MQASPNKHCVAILVWLALLVERHRLVLLAAHGAVYDAAYQFAEWPL